MSDFLEMPNFHVTEESSGEEVTSATGAPARVENLSALRLRDLKTGKFVAAPSHVTKRLNIRALKGLGEATTAGVLAGFVANQLPQNQRTWKQNKKKVEQLDPKLSVTLRRKSNE